MGLDWIPANKPKPGHEAEFATLARRLDEGDFTEARPHLNRLLGRLFNPSEARASSWGRLLDRYEAISIAPFDTLDAPRVGQNDEATEYARKAYAQSDSELSEEEWLESKRGLPVPALIEGSDGLPSYTHGGLPGDRMPVYSFRAKFLEQCEDIIGFDLATDCWVSKDADGTLGFGKALLRKAEDYARARGIELEDLDTEDWDSDEFRLDIVVSAGRWCIFWAERGHGLDVDY